MIGIAIKAGFTCTACESFVPVNAFRDTIRCTACGREFSLTKDRWSAVLDDAMEEAPRWGEGEGTTSTVFGELNLKLEYGRLQPRHAGTGEPVPEEDILAGLERGFVEHPGTGGKTSVRPFPVSFGGRFAGIVALVDEDIPLLSGPGEDVPLKISDPSNPVALQCPNCGGSLIVSGGRREERCRFCHSTVQLPHDLWDMLHPAPVTRRWYLLFDPSRIPFHWEEEIYGAVGDGRGNLVLVVENPHGDDPVIACVTPERKVLWSREDLSVMCRPEGMSSCAVPCFDGAVMLMHGNGRDLIVISAHDGSVSTVLEGSEPREKADGTFTDPFSMKDSRGLACLPDGSIILLRSREDRSGSFRELLRFDARCRPLPLWEPPEPPRSERRGLGEIITGWFRPPADSHRVPDFDELGDRPSILIDYSLGLAPGPDGSLYALCERKLAAFGPDGARRFCIELPCGWTHGGPSVNAGGDVFVLGEYEGDEYRILRISSDGSVTGFAPDPGSAADNPRFDLAVVASDGRVHALGYGGLWTIADTSVTGGQ